MEGGALFKVRSEAKDRVLAAFAAIDIRKNEVGGYAYNDANMLVTEIERVLAEQLFEDSTDGMKGLLSTATNTLTEYKATISIKRKDVLKDSKDAAARLSSSSGTTVQAEIVTNSDAQEEADRQNTYRLAAIGVKEGVAAGITKIVGKTSPTRSFAPRMVSASNQWTNINSTSSSLPSQRGQKDRRQQPSDSSLSTLQGQYSTGETQSQSTSKNLQRTRPKRKHMEYVSTTI